MHKLYMVVGKALLFGIGFFIIFMLVFEVPLLFTGGHDVMGIAGILQRPYYGLFLYIAPFILSASYITFFFSPVYLVEWLVLVTILILVITLFERSSLAARRRSTVLFYVLILPAAYTAITYVMRIFINHA